MSLPLSSTLQGPTSLLLSACRKVRGQRIAASFASFYDLKIVPLHKSLLCRVGCLLISEGMNLTCPTQRRSCLTST
jgi:hypothetical protein